MINFPSSPAVNDTVTSGTRTWTWNGTSWVSTNPISASSLIGTLAIANGGTGATTAANALAALGGVGSVSPTFTGVITNSGGRPITLDPASGLLGTKGSAGGWAQGLMFYGSSGTALGGFQALGNVDALDHFFVGTYSTGEIAKFYANGGVTVPGTLTAGGFSGPLTGNVTGNCSGSSGSCTGNAATASSASAVPWSGISSKPTTLSGFGITDWAVPTSGVDCNTTTLASGSYYHSANTPISGQSDGTLYHHAYPGAPTTWGSQIAQDYRTGRMWIRGRNNGAWSSWLGVIDSGNIGSQTVAAAGTATNHYGAGGNYIASSGNGTSYSTAIQIREAGLGGAQGSAAAYAPRLAFHWSAVVASSITMVASGNFEFRDNPGTGWASCYAYDFITSSDRRLKENISPVEGGLAKVLAMQGVTYDIIAAPEKGREMGLIAQDVQPICPELVREDGQGMLAVSYGHMAAVLIEAIKEQQKQIDELKALVAQMAKA